MEPRDPEHGEVNEQLVEAAMPIVEQFAAMTEGQIRRAIEPLEARISDLEGQVRDLQRVVTDTPDTADMENVDSGEA